MRSWGWFGASGYVPVCQAFLGSSFGSELFAQNRNESICLDRDGRAVKKVPEHALNAETTEQALWKILEETAH